MKKLAFAAALLAATAYSGSAFALSVNSAKGLQVSNDAVKVCYCHRPARYYHHRCGGCATYYVVESLWLWVWNCTLGLGRQPLLVPALLVFRR